MLHSDNLYACLRDNNSVCIFFKENNKTHARTHTNKYTNIAGSIEVRISECMWCMYRTMCFYFISRYSTEDTSKRVFHTSGLMRSKLSPDCSKLAISTHEGYMIIIHNLDLFSLSMISDYKQHINKL